MNWKKLLLIAIIAGGSIFVATPSSNAGVSVGIGLGVPVAYPYPYPYPYYGYYGPSVYVGPSFYWYRGHRVYYRAYHRPFRRW